MCLKINIFFYRGEQTSLEIIHYGFFFFRYRPDVEDAKIYDDLYDDPNTYENDVSTKDSKLKRFLHKMYSVIFGKSNESFFVRIFKPKKICDKSSAHLVNALTIISGIINEIEFDFYFLFICSFK